MHQAFDEQKSLVAQTHAEMGVKRFILTSQSVEVWGTIEVRIVEVSFARGLD